MTQLDVGNLALTHLGMLVLTQAQLTANTDPRAVAINTFWAPCRDEVLAEFPWSFGTTTSVISELTDLTDSEWDHIYTYPTSATSAVFTVFNDGTATEKDEQDFEVKYIASKAAKFIHTNLSDAIAEYTYGITDPASWSPKFVMAFSYNLASRMAVALTGNGQLAITMGQLYTSVLGEAKRINSTEKKKVPYKSQKLIDCR